MKLADKKAIVTGGGSGIGLGCALELAKNGADIVLNDRPGGGQLTDVVEKIRSLGRDCWPIEADIFERSGCQNLVREAISQAGKIDILISNPAYSRRENFLDYSPEEFEKTLRGTLLSGFHMSQLVARHMVERGEGGKLIFISSVHAEMPFARSIAYGAAKAGLNSMTQTIAVELFNHHINANCIEPGWIDTPGERIAFTEETLAREGAKLPWGRLGTPHDIGCAAAFLASSDSDYITGSMLRVDGGIVHAHCRNIPDERE